MSCLTNKTRLAHLRLEGLRPTDTVWFCARCEFQGALPANECPDCGYKIHAIRVPDVAEAREAA